MRRDELKRRISEAYESWSSPKYYFVEKRLAEGLYNGLIQSLSERLSVSNTTDPNDDVAICLFLEDGSIALGLKLSLVGPWAVITDPSGGIYALNEVASNGYLAHLRDELAGFGVEVLGQDDVIKKVEFGATERTLYEILFSADEPPRRRTKGA